MGVGGNAWAGGRRTALWSLAGDFTGRQSSMSLTSGQAGKVLLAPLVGPPPSWEGRTRPAYGLKQLELSATVATSSSRAAQHSGHERVWLLSAWKVASTPEGLIGRPLHFGSCLFDLSRVASSYPTGPCRSGHQVAKGLQLRGCCDYSNCHHRTRPPPAVCHCTLRLVAQQPREAGGGRAAFK